MKTDSQTLSRAIPYSLEIQLVEDFIKFLQSGLSPWGKLRIQTEFDYSRGKVDVVALNEADEVIAFEAKLTKWRDAAQQAYRNTCFANHSYVVLPEITAQKAANFAAEFEKRGIGICSVRANSVSVVHKAPKKQPIQEWLFNRAKENLARAV